MAHLVKAHYNAAVEGIIPEYWTPEGTNECLPCETKAEAEEVEKELATTKQRSK